MKICNRKSTINHFYFGFTLIELLVVIVIMMMLAGLLLPVTMRALRRPRERKREVDLKTLAIAITSYRHENMRWPVPEEGTGVYAGGEAGNNRVVAKLNEGTVRFINARSFSRDPDGNLVSPSGDPYEVEFITEAGTPRLGLNGQRDPVTRY